MVGPIKCLAQLWKSWAKTGASSLGIRDLKKVGVESIIPPKFDQRLESFHVQTYKEAFKESLNGYEISGSFTVWT